MSKKGMDLFLESLRSNTKLADDFARVVANIARNEGYDVSGPDVKQAFVDEKPSTRPLPPGDDSHRLTTLAIGEEHKPPYPRPLPPSSGGATSMAMGEEGTRPRY